MPTSSLQAKPPFFVSAPGGTLCSNYRALALLNATETINLWEEKPKKAVFLTDSLSALQALMSGEPDTTLKKLTKSISTLAQSTCIVPQWIPARTEIRGNETADQLAKEGRQKQQPPSHLSYREVKTLIHTKKKAIFHCKTGGYNPNQDAPHQLALHQQTTIFRLRTGHCRLNSHLKRISVKTSAPCPRRETDQTPENFPAILLTLPPSKAAGMAHLCVSQCQALGVCRIFVPDIQVCGTHW